MAYMFLGYELHVIVIMREFMLVPTHLVRVTSTWENKHTD